MRKNMRGLLMISAVFILTVLVGGGCGKAPKSLSEEEIAGFNTEFFNDGVYNMNNMLLSSEYGNPTEIDLFELFYGGMGQWDQESDEELTLLAELDSDAANLDVVKVTSGEMDAFLREKLGIGLSETQKTGLDRFYYLEDYDSYYLVGGTPISEGVMSFQVLGKGKTGSHWNMRKRMRKDVGWSRCVRRTRGICSCRTGKRERGEPPIVFPLSGMVYLLKIDYY